jgi:hypothetical protein
LIEVDIVEALISQEIHDQLVIARAATFENAPVGIHNKHNQQTFAGCQYEIADLRKDLN